MNKTYAVTLDIDWAPDWAIAHAASVLIAHSVKATWFVTHACKAVDDLRARPDLFELGIHPNCLPGSSHGTTTKEVLRHVLALVPDAVSMRSHGLYQSTNFLVLAASLGIQNDASLYLPGVENLAVHNLEIGQHKLARAPYCWEDSIEICSPKANWDLQVPSQGGSGLRIYNFHPIHIALNSASATAYVALKEQTDINTLRPESIAPHKNTGCGAATTFETLAAALRGGGSTIRELCSHPRRGEA